jgi:hypothetical protein
MKTIVVSNHSFITDEQLEELELDLIFSIAKNEIDSSLDIDALKLAAYLCAMLKELTKIK